MKTRLNISDNDISAAILGVYTSMYDPNILPEEMAEAYQNRYVRCIAPENIAAAQIFQAFDGEVYIAANVYSLAGASYYPRLISLTPVA